MIVNDSPITMNTDEDNHTDHHDVDHEHGHEHEHGDEHAISKNFKLTISLFSIFLALFIIFGNSTTLAAIARSFRLKTIPNMYIASLAVADMLVGFMMLIRGVSGLEFTTDFAEEDERFCLILMSLLFVSVAASMTSSILVACDRFAYIMYSLKYTHIVTKGKSMGVIIVAWIFSCAYGTVPIYTSHFNSEIGCTPTHTFSEVYMIIVHPTLFFTVCGITAYLYLRIARTALKQQRRIRDQNVSVNEDSGLRRVSGRTWKVVKLLMLVFGLFFISWLPLLILAFLEYTVHVSHEALSVGSLIAILNSGINFLVLCYMNKDFNLEFRQMLCVCCGKPCCCFKNNQIKPIGISTITSTGDSYE